tara:strand:+ start:102 stop:503 length:402 start_codon:yes stop_codon:yes gene_type:complete
MEDTNTLAQESPFARFGGASAVGQLTRRLYQIMDEDPAAARIRAIHGDDLQTIAIHVASFLTGWLGGPRDYFEDPERPCIMSAHRPFDIGPEDRDAWMNCMRKALDEQPNLDREMRKSFDQALYRLADGMRRR